MSSTQTTLPATSYPLSFQSPGASLPSFFTRRPLFSIASTLFFPPLFARQLPQPSVLPFVRVSVPPRQSIYYPFVFILLQIPFPATPFVSHLYKTPGGVGVRLQHSGVEILRMSPVASLERV